MMVVVIISIVIEELKLVIMSNVNILFGMVVSVLSMWFNVVLIRLFMVVVNSVSIVFVLLVSMVVMRVMFMV